MDGDRAKFQLTAIAATAARWDERVEPKHAFLKTCVFNDTRERVLIGA